VKIFNWAAIMWKGSLNYQLGLAYALPCTASFAISLLFALQGSWLLQARGAEIEIGRFVSAGRRRQVAKELRTVLAPERLFAN
jgi:hypothetical protein